MLVKTVLTALTTDSAGTPVESIPVCIVTGPVQDASGTWVDPANVIEDANGVRVRVVVGVTTLNSRGVPVDVLPVIY